MNPLGFVIITYNRPADMLAFAQNIASLDQATELLEEVIIVNNASTEDYSAVKEFIAQHPQIPFQFIDSPENLGVARGRNYAIARSTAPFLIMIDDDAVMGNKDCLVNLYKEFNQSRTDRETAIICFKVVYYDNGEMQVNAFPHKNFREYSSKHFFETYYYAGGAHAISRDVFHHAGKYPEDFFYGMEEYDLSYRIIDAGYSIVYTDSIIMRHKESPLGRKPRNEKLAMLWMNKSKVAWRYLPKKYFYSTAFMWSLEYLRKSGLDIAGWLKGIKEVSRIPFTEKRRPVSASTMAYLRRTEARLWY
ncbi:MAG TPA: glycosyltransferase [Chitinophagaceae bacterium]|nr:glycosyltransferase [Chitinophagaceae bacterium]